LRLLRLRRGHQRLLGLGLGLRLLRLRLGLLELGLRLGLRLWLLLLSLRRHSDVVIGPLNNRWPGDPRVQTPSERGELGHMRTLIEQTMDLTVLGSNRPAVVKHRPAHPHRMSVAATDRDEMLAASRHAHIRNTPKRAPSSTGTTCIACEQPTPDCAG